MGKWQTHSYAPQTRAKRSALSQQVTQVFGFADKARLKQVPQLHQLARQLDFASTKFRYDTFQKITNNKGAN